MENFVSYGIKTYKLSKKERKTVASAFKKARDDYEKQATPGAKKLLTAIIAGKAAFKSK